MTDNTAAAAAGTDQIDDKVVDATLNAYYPSVLSSADSARSRAQVAYTIASAIAAALITAGVLGHLQLYRLLVQICGGLTLIAWLTAAALFMRVSRKVTPPQGAGDGQATELLDAGTFVVRALQSAHAMGKAIDERLDLAVKVVYLALILTVLSFGLAFAFPPKGVIKENVSIDLTPAGSQLVSQVCGRMKTTITGGLEVGSLSKSLAAVDLAAGTCPTAGSGKVTLVIPVADITAIAENDGTPPFYP